MQQKEFKEILERYLQNSCTREERKLVEAWFDAVGKGEAVDDQRERDEELFKLYRDSTQRIFDQAPEVVLQRHSPYRWMKAAAVLVILLSTVLYFYVIRGDMRDSRHSRHAQASVLKRVVNHESSAQQVVLSDGSRVMLNPGAALSFKSQFDAASREVTLEGEAFFQVVHNSLPFVVKTGQLLTRVLGTSFTVKANEQDENITVTVKTGKVSVQSVPGEAGSDVTAEVLTPNQQAVYNIIKRTFSKRELAGQLTRPSNPPAGRRRFHEAPVTEIFHAVSALFGTPIIFDEEGLQRCMLSTSVSPDENIFYRVDIICKAIGATYKIDDGSIVVDGACSGVVKPDEIDP